MNLLYSKPPTASFMVTAMKIAYTLAFQSISAIMSLHFTSSFCKLLLLVYRPTANLLTPTVAIWVQL